jgi:hypothetical protein
MPQKAQLLFLSPIDAGIYYDHTGNVIETHEYAGDFKG